MSKLEKEMKSKKNQALIERDPEIKQTDVARLVRNAALIRQDLQRLNAERWGKNTTQNPLQNELLTSRLQDYISRQASAEAEANRQIAVIKQAKARLSRLRENLNNAKIILNNAKSNLANSEKIREKVENSQTLAQKREKSLPRPSRTRCCSPTGLFGSSGKTQSR